MLREIHIQNYAVVEDLAVEFHPGLNLLSGETGSGKSILVDALGLALGGRASADTVRTGQDRASVTAIFRAEGRRERGGPWKAWLEEFGLAGADEGEIILRRDIQSSGKSRLLVNDQPVTIAAVKALARSLAEVHGQGEHVNLFSRDAQLDLLDDFAQDMALINEVREAYLKRREIARELEALTQNEQDRLRTIDLLAFQSQELERAQLHPGEDVALEDERRILGNLEKIRAAASTAYGALYEEETSAISRVAAAARAMYELQRYDASFESRREPLEAARATIEDLAILLRNYLGKLEVNPNRLEEVEDRLALIDRLKRKYGKTIEEMVAYHKETQQRLSSLEHADERRGQLRLELKKADGDYRKKAETLSVKRREAAHKFEKLVGQELAQLGMDKTRFEINFEAPAEREGEHDSTGGAKGIDRIEFLISPNPGEELRPLEKIASGGELSRFMLALKTVVGSTKLSIGDGPNSRWAATFIFDEVDSGIGGRVAESVGQRLKRLARHAQVLCVTHLPQIACFADHHYYVEKFERGGRTVTEVKYLASEKERAAELARMLSGSKITDDVLKHASAMLKHAGSSVPLDRGSRA
ncbi:MAG TPA: DNA repair protein RecN [Terriglobia bacterium]|nr:DNA repair protein RecN [Terriglobia bacterium]